MHAAIEVVIEPRTVTRIEFDGRQPPPEMRGAGSDGTALCSNVFEIEAEIASALEVLSLTTVSVYPANFDIVTRLTVTIYMPKGSPDKLRAHEEAIARFTETRNRRLARPRRRWLAGRSKPAGTTGRQPSGRPARRSSRR